MAASKTKLRAQADALREQLCHPELHPTLFDDEEPGHRYDDPDCYAIDAAPLADKLARLVAQYMDPALCMEELENPDTTRLHPAAEVRAKYFEHQALARLTTKRELAKTLIDPYSGPAIVVAALHGKDSTSTVDAATLVEEIKRQAGKLAKGDTKAIRELMSVQALVAHQTALWTIHDAVNAASTEARSLVRKNGVTMLNSSQRMLERLARIDEARPAMNVSLAHNQQIVQTPIKVNGKTHKRLDARKATEVLPALARPRTVEDEHRSAVPEW